MQVVVIGYKREGGPELFIRDSMESNIVSESFNLKSDGAGGLRLPITPICLAGMLIEAPGAEHCIFDYPVVSRSEEK